MSPGAILVTGAAQRLGRAVALELARAGHGVAIHFNASRAPAEDLAREIIAMGAPAQLFQADLREPSTLAALVRDAMDFANGRLVGLVNCAASFDHDVIEDLTADAFHRQMSLNALAPCLLARELAASLGAGESACVVNFTDFKLANPYPDHFSYTLSKYALAGATEMLARALAPRVRVNAVAPGYVLAAPGQSDADYQRLHGQTPLGYGPTPEDVAAAARFLIDSPAITGQTITVDAGRRFRSYERDMAFL